MSLYNQLKFACSGVDLLLSARACKLGSEAENAARASLYMDLIFALKAVARDETAARNYLAAFDRALYEHGLDLAESLQRGLGNKRAVMLYA